MRKILLLDDYFPTGEQTVQPILLWGPGRSRQDLSHVTKTASEALDYIKNVVPEPGKTNMLLLALGSEEAYGPNRNGDGFPERPVPARHGKGYWIAPGQELTKHYQSFETNPAHAFKHHQNKDPSKASGVVKKAFWNPKMHRVELLTTIDNEKDAEWVQRVNDGDFPAVSMGCRIKYDVCSRCGNQAPTRAQYCDHVKTGMNQVNEDGTKNYVHNPDPSFFDISRVFRPADRTGYTLKKVAEAYDIRSSAELGDVADEMDRKSAALRKLSDIDKVIRGEPVASSSNLAPKTQTLIKNFRDYSGAQLHQSPGLPMDELHKHSAATVLATTAELGILLKDAEFIEFIASKLAGRRLNLGTEVYEKISALMPQVYDLFESAPSLYSETVDCGLLDYTREKVSESLKTALAPLHVKRAAVGEMLYRRLVPEGVGLRGDGAPTTDVLNYTDPHTGQQSQTTRGAAIQAQDATTSAHMRKVLGGSALMLGGYKALSAFPSLRNFKLPLAATAGAVGYNWLKKRPGHDVRTDEGYAIPDVTEFAPQSKMGAEENITPLVVHLLEASATRVSKFGAFGSTTIQRLKNAGTVDNIRGLELDFETVAAELGYLIGA